MPPEKAHTDWPTWKKTDWTRSPAPGGWTAGVGCELSRKLEAWHEHQMVQRRLKSSPSPPTSLQTKSDAGRRRAELFFLYIFKADKDGRSTRRVETGKLPFGRQLWWSHGSLCVGFYRSVTQLLLGKVGDWYQSLAFKKKLCKLQVNSIRGEVIWINKGYMLWATLPMGLYRAARMDLFERGSVCACVCEKEYWVLSSQMSAEQSLSTITSGHLGPINTASELQLRLLFLVPLLSLHHCLLP